MGGGGSITYNCQWVSKDCMKTKTNKQTNVIKTTNLAINFLRYKAVSHT